MYFIESIKCLNGQLQHLALHQARLAHTRLQVLGLVDPIDLATALKVPSFAQVGLWKCRVIYAHQIETIEFEPYQMKAIKQLVLVEDDQIDYQFKYLDRARLQAHVSALAPSAETDILIVKNGLITDSSYANVLFYDGCRWVTPATPLLAGVKRAYYLQKRLVMEADIAPLDLRRYKKVALINALRDLDSLYLLDIKQILGH